ncbi:hypothetical protein JZ751_028868 [Albula glossodonta]|uniref:peptidylprolyl isomerase n=1 Tax=Albula glossodonta TaxID=121402 RepID=A0A8T2NDD1_9TELE|nr:hypothetical protein JZ751_028868 [Albula glossodonta]
MPQYGMPSNICPKHSVSPSAKESWEMNTTEKLEQSAIVKEKGTQYFKDGKYKQASVHYKRIVSWLEHESGLQGEEEQKARALRLAAHLNLAMCYLKMHEQSQALESCDKEDQARNLSDGSVWKRGNEGQKQVGPSRTGRSREESSVIDSSRKSVLLQARAAGPSSVQSQSAATCGHHGHALGSLITVKGIKSVQMRRKLSLRSGLRLHASSKQCVIGCSVSQNGGVSSGTVQFRLLWSIRGTTGEVSSPSQSFISYMPLRGSTAARALELDDSNEKALFRRGEALFAMKEFERARADFQKVVQLYPSNKAAKSQVVLCQRQMKEQHEKDKRLYANMFQKFAERDAKASHIPITSLCTYLWVLVEKEAEKVKEEKSENGGRADMEDNAAREETAA